MSMYGIISPVLAAIAIVSLYILVIPHSDTESHIDFRGLRVKPAMTVRGF